MKILLILSLIFFITALSSAQNLLLKNATVYTFDRGVLQDCDVLVMNGKIEKIGKNLVNRGKVKELDLTGKSVVPGLIDSHNHIGLAGGINEFAENVTPEVKMEYLINPDDTNIYYCLTGGVTMVHTMHGSANPIGGENLVIKLKWGKTAEEIWERRAVRSLKMALGENPKRSRSSFPDTRMGVSHTIRKAFLDAQNYRKKWKKYRQRLRQTKKKYRSKLIPPRKDLRMEALVAAMEKRMPIRCHSYRAEESLELIELSKEFGFKVMAFEHIHQAYRIADELKANNIGISVFADSWNYKSEASEFTPFGFKILYQKGVEISLNSDSSERMRRLYIDAGKMRRYAGMNDLDALKTVTLNAAKQLGMEAYTGSIKPGKDADLAVFDGHPLSSMSKCLITIIEGEIYFDRSKDKYVGLKKKGGKK